MLTSQQRLMNLEQVSIRKTLNNRKALQIAVLTIHDDQKRYKQKKNIQAQVRYMNHQQKQILLRRISSSKFNILQSIKSRKSFQSDKNIELSMQNKSQSPKITEIYRTYGDISIQKSQKNLRNEILMHRMNQKLQKLHLRANINLLLKNRQITKTQRILTKQDARKHKNLHQSLSCREIMVQESKLFSNAKIKNSLKNNQYRAKITNRSNWKEKVQSRSLQSKLVEQSPQDRFSGWETNRRFQQQLDQLDDKNQVFDF